METKCEVRCETPEYRYHQAEVKVTIGYYTSIRSCMECLPRLKQSLINLPADRFRFGGPHGLVRL